MNTPLSSLLVHLGVLLVFLAALVTALGAQDVWIWAIGFCHLAYDLGLQALTLYQGWGLLRKAPSPNQVTAIRRHVLTVLVAARNEDKALPQVIAGLLSQSRPPDQIIIADDGSTDGTATILSQAHGITPPRIGECSLDSPVTPGLRWFRLAHGGKANALNQALCHAKGDIVLTVDADTVLDRHALAAMCEAFAKDPDLVAASGVLIPQCRAGMQGLVFQCFQQHEYIRNFLARHAWMRLQGLLLISGAFAAFRRDALLDVGGFDSACLVEDYELIHRLRRISAQRGLNWTTAVVGSAKAWTDAPADWRSFLKQRRRWFGGFLQTQYWYRDMVGQRRFGEVGMRMLPVKAADALQPLFGVSSYIVLAACLVRGPWAPLLPLAGWMGGKLVLDLAFHALAVTMYRQWTGLQHQVRLAPALAIALVEPFSFQLLRHAGALWGWAHFLSGQQRWDTPARANLNKPT